jgi:hypothetical protein
MCENCKCAELTKELADLKYNYEQLIIGLERQAIIARVNYDIYCPVTEYGKPIVA